MDKTQEALCFRKKRLRQAELYLHHQVCNGLDSGVLSNLCAVLLAKVPDCRERGGEGQGGVFQPYTKKLQVS